jgi:hypothetical protein
MLRRLISSIALLACASIYTFAAERATFILTDGERKSGPVVFHGDQHENLINGFLNLGADNGKEMTFPVDQVAVIDFVGGQPPNTELAQLGAAHMLVTRDGTAQQGRLINLIGGDTLLWENLAKQRQQFAIRDVSRVYLNASSARSAFNYTAPAPVAPPVATAQSQPPAGTSRDQGNQGNQRNRGNRGDQGNRDQNNQGVQGGNRGDRNDPGYRGDRRDQGDAGNRGDRRDQGNSSRGTTVRIDPRQGWTDTGLTVNRGERIEFDSNGPTRGLLGRIGNGATFAIDADQQSMVMRASGPLMLSVSDDERRGNRDVFSVIVSRP